MRQKQVMKCIKYNIFSVLILLLAAVSITSCSISNKDFLYLQGSEQTYAVPKEIEGAFQLTIQPDDELAISVSSKDPELIEPFTNNALIGAGTHTTQNTSSASQIAATSRAAYFIVGQDGCIEFPIFGRVQAAGKTTRQLADELQKRFIDENYILDASVNIRLMNFKISVLGDVKTPGTKTYTTERVSLLDAIAGAGDLNSTANRRPILVLREQNGERVAYEVDLSDATSVFNSPVCYLQQNDVIYVQPNKSARIKGSTGYTFISVGSTVLGLVVSVTSLIISLSK